MFRRALLIAAAGSLVILGAACNAKTDAVANQKSGADLNEPKQPVNIGAALYQNPIKANPAPEPAPTSTIGSEPILIGAYTTIAQRGKVDIPSQRDSRILFIGTEGKQNDLGAFQHHEKWYRPLEPGEIVKPDQIVMLLDDREAAGQFEAASAAYESAKVIYERATTVLETVQKMHNAKENLFKRGGSSDVEYYQSLVELERAKASQAQQKADMIKAEEEMKKAKINYDFFTIRSNIEGTLLPFSRNPGESVKALETVLQVQSSAVLRAEGNVLSGYTYQLKRGMPVWIEPTQERAPKVHRKFHTQAVNGVAVGGTADKPVIISVSDDKTARVWDGRSDFETAIFTHPGAVRSVACSPPTAAKMYCLTGAEDGTARLWSLSNPKSSKDPVRELQGGHKGAISAVAFSPDGKLCATADARDIVLWDVETGGQRYRFPPAHLGDITSLTFTPQAKLVSASKDMTVRVWSLGQEGAKLDYTQEGRSGDVSRLGVSPDGRYFLFDISQTLRLMTVADRRTVGVVEGVNEAAKFASFAVFSHDSKLVLTGSPNEGRLSVWRTPTPGNRATELRTFMPRGRMVNFTCADVAPFDNEPFAVSGTRAGDIFVWAMPTEKESARLPGTLKFVDISSTPAQKQVRVWAEFANPPQLDLKVGTNVTIIVEPPSK